MKRIAHQSEKIEDSLQRIPFFSGLPPDMLSAIAAKLQYEHYYHGEVVFVEGSVGDSFYLIEFCQMLPINFFISKVSSNCKIFTVR